MILIRFYEYLRVTHEVDGVEVNGIDELRDYISKYLKEHNGEIYYAWEPDGVCIHQVLMDAVPETDMDKMTELIVNRVKEFGYCCVNRLYSDEEKEKVLNSDTYYGDDDDYYYQPIIIADLES